MPKVKINKLPGSSNLGVNKKLVEKIQEVAEQKERIIEKIEVEAAAASFIAIPVSEAKQIDDSIFVKYDDDPASEYAGNWPHYGRFYSNARQKGTWFGYLSNLFDCNSRGKHYNSEFVCSGGFGAVYTSIDRVTGEKVAYKVLKVTYDNLEEIEAEITNLQRFPDIFPRLYAAKIDNENNIAVIIMEAFDGDLKALVKQIIARYDSQPVRINLNMILFIKAVNKLSELHDRGLSHNDVKPGNFLVRTKGLNPEDIESAEVTLGDAANAVPVDTLYTRKPQSPSFSSPYNAQGIIPPGAGPILTDKLRHYERTAKAIIVALRIKHRGLMRFDLGLDIYGLYRTWCSFNANDMLKWDDFVVFCNMNRAQLNQNFLGRLTELDTGIKYVLANPTNADVVQHRNPPFWGGSRKTRTKKHRSKKLTTRRRGKARRKGV